jgi:hypothetical protein
MRIMKHIEKFTNPFCSQCKYADILWIRGSQVNPYQSTEFYLHSDLQKRACNVVTRRKTIIQGKENQIDLNV